MYSYLDEVYADFHLIECFTLVFTIFPAKYKLGIIINRMAYDSD